MDAAARRGIPVRKQWLATLDNRTRHAHADADTQTVEPDQPFELDGHKLMFPGDRSAPGYLVYNCRCTITSVIAGFSVGARRARDTITGRNEVVEGMSYREWEAKKRAENPEAFDAYMKRGKNLSADRRQYSDYRKALGKHTPKTLADFQDLKYNSPNEWSILKRRRHLKSSYDSSVAKGVLSALTGFDDYLTVTERIERELIGITTADGVQIKEYATHFIDRIIGSYEQHREPVSIEDVRRTLITDHTPRSSMRNGACSRLYRSATCWVSVNPAEGRLIQTSPRKRGV